VYDNYSEIRSVSQVPCTEKRLFKIILEALAAHRMAQLTQRLGLNLPNAFAGNAKHLSHFF